jgi:hypothetical protein
MPWVDTTGIKQYDEPPLGKLTGAEDIDLRPMLRLMAAGAIVVAPHISPFSDVIVDRWNGVLYKGEPDFSRIGNEIKTDAETIASRSKEFSVNVLNKERYIQEFIDVVGGNSFDYNEPWIDIKYASGHEWIILKETISGGEVTQIPAQYSDRFKIMKTLSLEQLLNYFANMKFKEAFIFDAIIEELDTDSIGSIHKAIAILGDRVRQIKFCFDPPEEWSHISNKLIFISPSEASKQVL